MSPAHAVLYAQEADLDARVAAVLHAAGLTGMLESSLPERLGRPLDPALADLGRLLFFDNVLGLHEDNSGAGCHGPAFGFDDSQSVAIGVQNNGVVGPARGGPRNQRKSPIVINSAFLPKLMLNGRFLAKSGDPFDNSLGFSFPAPEGDGLKFAPGDPRFPTLLSSQGIMPSTELVEMAGFTGAARSPFFRQPDVHQFDDGLGTRLPQDTNSSSFPDPVFSTRRFEPWCWQSCSGSTSTSCGSPASSRAGIRLDFASRTGCSASRSPSFRPCSPSPTLRWIASPEVSGAR